MKLVLGFVFIIIPNILWAEDLSVISYFDDFHMAFSINKISERDYNLLVSLECK